MDNFKLKFLEEAADLIEDLEKILMSVEKNGISAESIEHIFRVMHTIKGSSSMFGFDIIGEFTHHLENIYDLVRTGKMEISNKILDVTLASIDHIRALLVDEKLSDESNKTNHEELLQRIKAIVGFQEGHKAHTPVIAKSASVSTYYILFKPAVDILTKGNNPLYLLSDLQDLSPDNKVFWHFENVHILEELKPQDCHIFWEIVLSCKESEHEIKDVFIFVEDECELVIQKLADEDLFQQKAFSEYIKNLSDTPAELQISGLTDFIENRKSNIHLIADKLNKAAGKQEDKQGSVKDANGASIRVSSDKLDDLLNLVSELVTTQARLSLYASNNLQNELQTIAENVEKISRRLRDNTFSICLIPIESLLTRFQRLIRDLSKQLNKEIAFISEGTETEIDKTIIDNLTDPLMHIFRNCIDHGIEDSDIRIQKGKPKKGTIALRAYYSGTNVHIEIKDDGGGINPVKIREKAISKGLIAVDAQLTEKQIFDLMFLPGFSTASQVTEVSGRGVGMDVVKRQILALRGAVEVESKVDEGTAITIILPLTLSIIDGLLVQIHNTKYVIPLSVVHKCYEVKNEDITNKFDNVLEFDNELLPFCNLREEFEVIAKAPEIQQVIIVRNNDKKIGITVDYVLGEYQAVLKPLGKLYNSVDIMSGATILGDGTIALVMDTNQIIKKIIHRAAV